MSDTQTAQLFAAVRLEVRPCLAHILGCIELLKREFDALGAADLGPDLEKIKAATESFHQLFESLIDSEGRPKGNYDMRKIRHDLRTPVGHIVGYSEILSEEAADRRLTQLNMDLDRLCNNARQLLRLVNESLDINTDQAPVAEVNEAVAEQSDLQRSSVPNAAGVIAEILVVDDNEANRDLLSRHLARHGHAVTTAENGKVALEKMEGSNFDLVLLDVMMPVMDGFQVLQYAKNDPNLRNIPIIMISALNEMETVIKCIEVGAEDYLQKPFNPVLLQARLNACLEKKSLRDQEQRYLRQLELEQARSEKLLLNILPGVIAGRLKRNQRLIADNFPEATVLFADIIGFTEISSRLSAQSLVKSLNLLFSCYDSLADKYSLEKIKTIGDAYMAASGLPIPREDHAAIMIEMALEMLEETERMKPKLVRPFDIRVGVCSGPVVAGVIGHRKFCYDLWGDTVNTASRMSSIGNFPHVRITESTYKHVSGQYEVQTPEPVEVKGKGKMTTYIITKGPQV